MADIIDNPSSTAGKKPEAKDGRTPKRVLRWFKGRLSSFKRPTSANPSAIQPNSTRISVSSTPDLRPGNDAGSAEPRASGSNVTSHQDPTAPFESTRFPLSTVPDRPSSAVDQGHGNAASRTSTLMPQATAAKPPTQVPHWKANAKEGLGVASRFTQMLLRRVPECLDGNPVKMAFSIAKAVGDNEDELAQRLEEKAKKLLAVETTMDNGVPEAARQAMETFKKVLGDEMGQLKVLSEKSQATKILDHEDSKKKVQRIFQRIEAATRAFEIKMSISIQNTTAGIQNTANHIQNMTISIQNTTTSSERTAALERLRPSYKADHKTVLEEKTVKREECTAGTRIKILEDITKWANDSSPESACVFWLTGQAGSGKTTIAYTIAKSFEKADQQTVLGANFLCSRQFEETRQRTRIVPTIAYQLARRCKPYAATLHAADKYDAVNHDISTQLKDLLVGPCQQSEAALNKEIPPYLIVIDALDEIEGNGGSAFLRNLLVSIEEYDLQGFKFLVTSRPDPEIVALCASFTSKAIVRLQDVPTEEAESDIRTYLETKLPKIASSPELAELGSRAGGLFIYAATAVKHLTRSRSTTSGEQTKMLKKLLSNSRESGPTNDAMFLIDELYRQIMHDTFSQYGDEETLTRRLHILYTFLCTAERTSTSVVAGLVAEGDDDADAVARAVAEDLHAVLYTQDDRVFWYHASFPDFIFNPARSNFRLGDATFEFSCNEPAHHNLLGESCFRVMFGLRFNMGDIKSSFLFDSDNADVLSEKVNKNINAVLRYSCRHWTQHLPSPQSSIDTKNLRHCISDFLQIRILFWIEAMNLLGSSNQCTPMLQCARQWLLKSGTNNLELASDVGEAANFATHFIGSPAAKSTPHLWVNSVAFSSDGTRIVSGSHDQSVRVWDASTGAELKVLNGHTSVVTSVAFSSDGTRIASSSHDQSLRVWDASTGTELKVLYGHTNFVSSVAFSSDSTRIVSGSYHHSIRVYDALTSAELKMFNGHTNSVNSVAFSNDGTRIVSGSHDHSVRVWDASTGVELKVLNGHTNPVTSVAFSSDGTGIVSGSYDESARVWDVSTGAELKVLNGHTSWVNSVAFSSDDTRIVSGSTDESVQVWDALTGAKLKVLNGHTGIVTSVAFSSDGRWIVSGSYDGSVRVWDASTGADLKVLNGHATMITSVAFSNDGTCIVSGSSDGSVRVWDASTGAELNVLNGHTSWVNSVVFSSDGTRIVSGSSDSSVRVWDALTGAELKVLNGHSNEVNSVVFLSDGTRLVSDLNDESVRIWILLSCTELNTTKGRTNSVNPVTLLSDDDFGWSLAQTNWIISSPGQNHLMWVPPQAQVAQPSHLIISCHGFGSVDFHQSLLGIEWVGCYTP